MSSTANDPSVSRRARRARIQYGIVRAIGVTGAIERASAAPLDPGARPKPDDDGVGDQWDGTQGYCRRSVIGS